VSQAAVVQLIRLVTADLAWLLKRILCWPARALCRQPS